MPIAKSESLILLIHSLSKSEKRSFKLYTGANQAGKDLLYVKLFELLDKSGSVDDTYLKKKLGDISNTAYSNLKKHLFEQLMISLRLIQKEKKQNFKIREYIDFTYVLYGKGLHMQALEVLQKAKKLSQKHYNDFSLLTIIELEKMIQSRHITRSKSEPITNLMNESAKLSLRVSQRITLSNIRLKLHKYYVEQGHIESKEKEAQLIQELSINMEKIEKSQLEGIEIIYYYQSYVWLYYILDQFDKCLDWAIKWVNEFKASEELKRRDVDLFMRGYHYVLTSAFNIKSTSICETYLKELEDFRNSNYSKLNHNSQIVSFQYVHNGRMNLHFLKGTFEEGIKNIPNTIKRINRYAEKLDSHKVMVIYYKVAWMYIGVKNPTKAIHYLDEIINLSDKSLRLDIQCYTRLMKLIALYDSEEFNTLKKNTTEINKYFEKNNVTNKVQTEVLNLFHALSECPILERKSLLKDSLFKLEIQKQNSFERRAFIYLDILPWIKSKITRQPLGATIASSIETLMPL